jgi:hypothetical protein
MRGRVSLRNPPVFCSNLLWEEVFDGNLPPGGFHRGDDELALLLDLLLNKWLMKLPVFGKVEISRHAIKVFVTVWVLGMAIVVVKTSLLPKTFSGTVHVRYTGVGDNSLSSDAAWRNEAQIVVSKPVLTQVVGELNLCGVWSRKFFDGEPLKTNEVIEILVGRYRVDPAERDSSGLTLIAYSDAPKEAAQMANALAVAYRQYRNTAAPLVLADASPVAKTSTELVQILDEAQPMSRPCKPNVPFNLALGAVVNIFGGLLAAVLAVSRRHFFKSPRLVKPSPAPPSAPASDTGYTDTPIKLKY